LGSFCKKRRDRFLSLLLWRHSKAHTWPTTVLVDELDISLPDLFDKLIAREFDSFCGILLAIQRDARLDPISCSLNWLDLPPWFIAR
jgi:hypothetical protein